MQYKPLDIIYCCDPWENRAKKDGRKLMNQAIISIESLRKNWNTSARILLLHTKKFPNSIQAQFKRLMVKTIKCTRSIEPQHLMANKILPIHITTSKRDQLFLDCDTIVHQPVELNRNSDILVAFDVLMPMPQEVYNRAFTLLGVEIPTGKTYRSPAKHYYETNDKLQFPVWNAGVHYINGTHRVNFYRTYLRFFRRLFNYFNNGPYEFYIETLAFTASALYLNLNIKYFSKGINFICTPRADYLLDWPRSQIIVEHYAGDTSSPLQFNGESIAPSWTPSINVSVNNKHLD